MSYPAPPPGSYPPPVKPPKPFYKQTWFIIVAVIVAVIIVCCAGSAALLSSDDGKLPAGSAATTDTGSSAAAKPAETKAPVKTGPLTVKLGETIEAKDGSAVAKIVVTKFNGNVKSNNQFVKPSNGQFTAAWIEISGVSGEPDFGPSNFRLIGPDGSVFNSYYIFEPMNQMMDTSTKVREGQKKSGWVVFDCAPGNYAGSKIEMNDDFGQRLIGYWQT